MEVQLQIDRGFKKRHAPPQLSPIFQTASAENHGGRLMATQVPSVSRAR